MGLVQQQQVLRERAKGQSVGPGFWKRQYLFGGPSCSYARHTRYSVDPKSYGSGQVGQLDGWDVWLQRGTCSCGRAVTSGAQTELLKEGK